MYNFSWWFKKCFSVSLPCLSLLINLQKSCLLKVAQSVRRGGLLSPCLFSLQTTLLCLDLPPTNSYCSVSVYKTLKSSRNLWLPNWAGRSVRGTSRPCFQTCFTSRRRRFFLHSLWRHMEKNMYLLLWTILFVFFCFCFLISVSHGVLLIICSVRKLNCFENKIWSWILPPCWEKKKRQLTRGTPLVIYFPLDRK